MGRVSIAYLSDSKIWACGKCGTHVTRHDDIVSKQFQGRTGRAYLFSSINNVSCGPVERRVLTTGVHQVSDVYCVCCGGYMGWQYVDAEDEDQKYKIGKSVLEMAKLEKITRETESQA